MTKKADVTIKELADELGITKQAVRRYFEQLPTELVPTKKSGSYQISLKAQSFIRDKVNRVDTNVGSQLDTNKIDVDTKLDSDVDTRVDSQSDSELAKFQKEFIQDKNEQIESLKEQVSKLHTLLDQQQQLTLQSNKQIEKLQLQLGTTISENSEKPKTEEPQQTQQTTQIREELDQKNLENEQLKQEVAKLKEAPKKGFWQRLFNS